MRFEVIDQCPVPAKLAPAVERIKHRTGATLNSCDRSREAEPLLRRFGKLSQRQLYEGFIRGRPGFNPANPPGRSTHERRNDGVAYPGPIGDPLPYWCVGMDWSNPGDVIRAARAEGYTAQVTYGNNNPREAHHIKFRKEPRIRILLRTLRRGSSGPAVVELTRRWRSSSRRSTAGRTSREEGGRSMPTPNGRSSASRRTIIRQPTACTDPAPTASSRPPSAGGSVTGGRAADMAVAKHPPRSVDAMRELVGRLRRRAMYAPTARERAFWKRSLVRSRARLAAATSRAYEGRRDLGNVRRGHGPRYGGRGRIMVTGRGNYAAMSKAFGQDFVSHPERLAQSPVSELASCWWWSTHDCNALADSGDFVALTRRINGGVNGLADRQSLHGRARHVARWLVPKA